MRVLVVQESMFGCTAAVAYRIASALHGLAEVEVVHAADAPADPAEVDLLVVGAPTHGLSLPNDRTRALAVAQGAPAERRRPGVREWLSAMPGGRPTRIALFGTELEAMRHMPGAARAAARLARRRGLRVVGAEEFLVHGTAGPLLDGELDRAARWALGLVPPEQPTP